MNYYIYSEEKDLCIHVGTCINNQFYFNHPMFGSCEGIVILIHNIPGAVLIDEYNDIVDLKQFLKSTEQCDGENYHQTGFNYYINIINSTTYRLEIQSCNFILEGNIIEQDNNSYILDICGKTIIFDIFNNNICTYFQNDLIFEYIMSDAIFDHIVKNNLKDILFDNSNNCNFIRLKVKHIVELGYKVKFDRGLYGYRCE